MSKPLYRTSPDPKETGWPSGVPYIIGNEGCERFSYYGMKAILYVYVAGLLINLNGMAQAGANAEATRIAHLFFAAVYAFPLIGAIIADRFLGKYRTIISLSIIYCLGHLALAVFEKAGQEYLFGQVFINPIHGLYLGLTLIAIGSGGIKPCVSAHVGDQFGPGNWHLLQKVFNAFYFIINFGSALSTILIPYIRGTPSVTADGLTEYSGSVGLAFAVPGILMGLATIAFWMGRKVFIHVPPTHPGMRGFLDVLSGSALFMVVGVPIFGHEVIHSLVNGTLTGSVELDTRLVIGIGSAVCLALFVVLFSIRQRIEQDDGFLAMMFYSARCMLTGGGEAEADPKHADAPLASHWFFGPAARRFGQECAEGPLAVVKIMSIFIFISVFWALFEQHSTTWIEQAKSMDRGIGFSKISYLAGGATLGLIVAGAFLLTLRRLSKPFTLAVGAAAGVGLGYFAWWAVYNGYVDPVLMPSQIPATNPFMVMILIPYTTFGLYPLMAKLGLQPTPLRRITIGMFIASASFATVAVLQMTLDGGRQLHVGWQLIPYAIITLAEVMVSITGLEFAYSQAPKRMKSVVMGFWLFIVTLGNVMVAFLAGFQGLDAASFFWTFTGLMALAAVLFGLRAIFYEYKDYTQ